MVPPFHLTLLLLYTAVNTAFLLKYLPFSTSSNAIISTLYAFAVLVPGLFLVSYQGRKVTNRWMLKISPRLPGLVLLGLLLLLHLGALIAVDLSQVTVNRAAAVADWWNMLIDSNWPYAASEDPSGFPVLFLIVGPFVAIGEPGLLGLLATGLLGWMLVRRRPFPADGTAGLHISKASPADGAAGLQLFSPLLALVLLIGSPAVLYETAVRSDLMPNIILATLFAWWFAGKARVIAEREARGRILLLIGIIMGLLFSTRLLAAVLIMPVLIQLLMRCPQNGMRIIGYAVLTFVLTLLPFLFWQPGQFFASGPHTIQGGYTPLWLNLSSIAAVIVLGTSMKTRQTYLFWIAILMTLVPFIAMLLHAGELGWTRTFFGDGFDLAYLSLGLPAMLLGVAEQEPENKRSPNAINIRA